MRCRINVVDSFKEEIEHEYKTGRVYKEVFFVDKRENPLFWVVTHINTGSSVAKGVKSQEKAMELIDNIEHVIDWSSIKIVNKVLMEGSTRVETTKIKKIQKILERYNG